MPLSALSLEVNSDTVRPTPRHTLVRCQVNGIVLPTPSASVRRSCLHRFFLECSTSPSWCRRTYCYSCTVRLPEGYRPERVTGSSYIPKGCHRMSRTVRVLCTTFMQSHAVFSCIDFQGLVRGWGCHRNKAIYISNADWTSAPPGAGNGLTFGRRICEKADLTVMERSPVLRFSD